MGCDTTLASDPTVVVAVHFPDVASTEDIGVSLVEHPWHNGEEVPTARQLRGWIYLKKGSRTVIEAWIPYVAVALGVKPTGVVVNRGVCVI